MATGVKKKGKKRGAKAAVGKNKRAAGTKTLTAKASAKANTGAAKKAKKSPAKPGVTKKTVAKKTTEKTAKKAPKNSAKKPTTKTKPTASKSRVAKSGVAAKPKAALKPKAAKTAVETPMSRSVAKTSAATAPKPKKPAGNKTPAPLAAVHEHIVQEPIVQDSIVPEATVVSQGDKPSAGTLEPAVEKPQAPARTSFYVTTAIAYPNGVPHIGHAYEAIATDALARFARLDGKDVFFLTGTDEHGLKMMQTAQLENLPTLEVATRNAARFKDMDRVLDISYNRFIRTSEEQHHRSSQAIW
jgi:methionyl-tRNA synthetase